MGLARRVGQKSLKIKNCMQILGTLASGPQKIVGHELKYYLSFFHFKNCTICLFFIANKKGKNCTLEKKYDLSQGAI